MYILKLLLLLNALSLSRLMDDDETDEDRHPDHERRHQHAYSLAQKVRYLDDYIQAHILGQPHARTPTAFARHNRIHPRTFLDWLANEDDLRNSLENRPTRDGRRRRRRPEGGNLLFHSITLQLCPKRESFLGVGHVCSRLAQIRSVIEQLNYINVWGFKNDISFSRQMGRCGKPPSRLVTREKSSWISNFSTRFDSTSNTTLSELVGSAAARREGEVSSYQASPDPFQSFKWVVTEFSSKVRLITMIIIIYSIKCNMNVNHFLCTVQ